MTGSPKATRICRKCNEIFPMYQKIDGKRRNFAGRKFCLKCSPFGYRNTKPDDPSRPSIPHYRNGLKYKDLPPEQKYAYQKRYYDRGLERKQKLVDQLGGACQECGYKKCLRCLTFHHIDPAAKDFCLTIRELSGMSWESVEAEVAKCKLLCLNCHMELEDKLNGSKFRE